MHPRNQERCSGLWRSEDMARFNIILQREALHDTVLGLGVLGKVQFVDLNDAHSVSTRHFTPDIQRCVDLQRKLLHIEEEFHKYPRLMNLTSGDPDMASNTQEMRAAMMQVQIEVIEERIENTLLELNALVASLHSLENELNHHQAIQLLYHRLQLMTNSTLPTASSKATAATQRLLGPTEPASSAVSFHALAELPSVLGIIDAARAETLFHLCYRVTRGNAIVEINNESEFFIDFKSGERKAAKATFIILSLSARMIARLRRLVESLGATVYDMGDLGSLGKGPLYGGMGPQREAQAPLAALSLVPGDASHCTSSTANTMAASIVEDLNAMMANVLSHKENFLLKWYPEHRIFKAYLRVEKAILATMNLCTFSGSTCVASLWIASKYADNLQRVMDDAVTSSGSEVRSILIRHPRQGKKPTYFELNRFTRSFQAIVDSYGIARYKEINPGVFTIITFPYLFGIMYGDIGHGLILFVLALYLIYKERSWKNQRLPEMLALVFSGRYLLLLMALFAIYMGFLYNDFFGFSLNLFHSGYIWAPVGEQSGTTYPIQPNGQPSLRPNHVYVFGLDVAWTETENKLEVYNSIKMKCAVIVGIVQTLAGVALSLYNYLYEKNWNKVIFVFLPECVFLLSTFGYMCVLIVVKWCVQWERPSDAPSILEVMTNFFLQPGHVPQPLFCGQAGMQLFLLLLAAMMVLVMLLGLPLIEYRAYRRWRRSTSRLLVGLQADAHHADDPHDFFRDTGGTGTLHLGHDTVIVNERVPSPAKSAHGKRAGRMGCDIVSAATSEACVCDADLLSMEGSLADDVFEMYNAPMGNEEADGEEARFRNFDFTELMIHYIIHTIEFVLGSVSTTASYLRLWALSLAHAQLSEVFFTFAVVDLLGKDATGGFVIGLGIFVWLGATLGVLVGMEALSAFLHALRLHWVEFQNKFYAGDGVSFVPLDLLAADP